MCIALRFIEGVGTALFNTAGNTLITQLFPESMGLLVVREREREKEKERELSQCVQVFNLGFFYREYRELVQELAMHVGQ